MKYSKDWLYIDIAIFITFLPFIFVIPFLMKIFVFIGLYFIYKKQTTPLWIIGGISIVFHFYNLIELKNFNIYLQFLVSLLIWGVYLQRTQNKNNYILLSPILFFGLSIVFFQNIYMLFYSIFEVFGFLFLIFYIRLNNYKSALKESGFLFLISMPLVIILFLFFPRYHNKFLPISFNQKIASGFSKNLDTNIKDVTLSSLPIIEFKLKHIYPILYLKGNVLYDFKNGIWYESNSYPKDTIISLDKIESYYLKQYPTNNKFIFAIDLPFESGYGKLNKYYILKSKKNIKTTLFFQLSSAIKYKIAPLQYPYLALKYNKNYNKKAQLLAKEIFNLDEKTKLKKIIEIFKTQKIKYTLHPKNIDSLNIIDSLFQNKEGFCTHFASAFAIFSRMAGIPSRIVNGYVVSKNIKGYYKIYESDAHAWVEVLVDGIWQRIDPTTFAISSDFIPPTTSKLNLYISYMKFILEEWILHYNASMQEKFFNYLKIHFFKVFGIFILFLGVIIFIILKLKQNKNILSPLYKKLGNSPKNESVYNFLKKYNDKKLNEINNLYQKITFYKSTKEDIKKLKKLIKDYNG